MDQGLVTQISLIVAVLGVLGTFIAPRLVASSRIYFEGLDLSRIDSDEPTERIKIQVFHDDELVLDPVFILTGQISNTGSKDVTRAEFVEPTSISLDDNAEILSVDASAPDGVNVEAEVVDGRCRVLWSILKPGETIELKVVARALDEGFDHREALDSVKFVARLRDVKVGPGMKRFLPLGAGLLTSFTLMAFIGGAFFAVNVFGTDRWVFRDPKTQAEFALRETEWPNKADFEACRVKAGKVSGDCRDLTADEARARMATAHRAKMGAEIDKTGVAAGLLAALLYGFALPVSVVRMAKIIRRMPKRSLARVLLLAPARSRPPRTN